MGEEYLTARSEKRKGEEMFQVRELRGRLRLSRVELARFLGVSEATVVRWETSAGITEPKGLQAILLNQLRLAVMNNDLDQVTRVVRHCSINHAEALNSLLILARATRKENTPVG